ncbi:zf-CSL-domain-containing protein [Mycena floridula]|nr:zf-CSL-domain-containing protein [Mycena floridula]
MGAYYDEIEIEDMVWDAEKRVYHYPCPCGDRFEISRQQLTECEDIATCPSCSLIIRVIYDPLDYEDAEGEEEEENDGSDSDDEDFVDAMDALTVKD